MIEYCNTVIEESRRPQIIFLRQESKQQQQQQRKMKKMKMKMKMKLSYSLTLLAGKDHFLVIDSY